MNNVHYKLSFQEQYAVERSSHVTMLMRFRNCSLVEMYAYVRVEKSNVKSLYRAMNSGSLNLHEFGEILKQGYGEPDEFTKRYMELHYNVDHSSVA